MTNNHHDAVHLTIAWLSAFALAITATPDSHIGENVLLRTSPEISLVEQEYILKLAALHSKDGKNDLKTDATNNNDDACTLYVAPSTIPNAGVGIFTTKPILPNELVGYSDMAIPIVDFGWLPGFGTMFNPFSSYVWHYQHTGMHTEVAPHHVEAVSAFGPGLDSAVNMHSALINTERNSPIYDTAGLHRNQDAGAGAITPYHHGTTYATNYIPAGGELFKSYGDEWFPSRGLDFVPEPDDYEIAEQISQAFDKLNVVVHAKEKLWNLVREWPMWEERARNALPSSMEEAIQASRTGIRSLHQPLAIRTLEDLQENGRCMDSIQPGVSTIPGAGYGAFATRALQSGTVIAGSGLLWLPYWDLIDMYDADKKYKHEQILVNYCWGHPQSTLLLCPYGAGVGYINHHQHNNASSSLANVKIQWAPDGVLGHNSSTMFHRSVASMENDYSVNLAFDYVAIRDIEPGEELFLDYGSGWQEAWDKHVKDWKPANGSEHYAPAMEWNKRLKDHVLRTKLEQERDPYPSNLLLRCHSDVENELADWSLEWDISEPGQACDIQYRSNDEAVPTYWIKLADEQHPLIHVPRGAFRFFDKPYSTDHHMSNSFRHYMMIPDDMFPQRWRNFEH